MNCRNIWKFFKRSLQRSLEKDRFGSYFGGDRRGPLGPFHLFFFFSYFFGMVDIDRQLVVSEEDMERLDVDGGGQRCCWR